MDTFPTGSSSRCWHWSQQTQKDIFLRSRLYLCLAQVLKMMVGNNLKDTQLQQVINSSYHLCTCRFLFKNWKKATTAKNEDLTLFLSNYTCLPFFRLWTRQFSSTTRTTPARSTSRSFARSFFLDVPISNFFAGGWKHGYSHEDGCGSVSWHLRVRG